jgi:hypothetical protein
MKIFLDVENQEYLEVKSDDEGNVDLSLRTNDSSRGIIITAKLKQDILDKLIANLILLKTRKN